MDFSHVSVLLNETIEGLNIKENGIYVDGTLGGGGHAFHVCEKLSDKARFIGIDQDAAAIEAASIRLSPYIDKVHIDIVRSNYQKIPRILQDLNVSGVDGIVLDLGVSSYQLDTPDRGFSYREDAPLDMRMDQSQEMTAKDIINEYSEGELYRVIRDYGEEKFAKNIAKHIVNARKEKVISTTFELNEIIKAAIPIRARSAGASDALLPVGLGCCGRRWVTAPSVHQRTHPLSAYTPLSAIRWQHRGFAMLSLW